MKQNDRERGAFHRAEEQRHAEHMARRIAAREGDGTIEQGEAELASIRRIAKIRKLEAENAALRRQIDEALAGSNQDTEETARWLIRNPQYEVQS